MSGIIGIVQFDGSFLDPDLLRRLTGSLAFRGPDHQRIWIKQNVGLGHTLFKTTEEDDNDSQPLTLDGRTWIVADARIDAREDLFTALKAAGEHLSESRWTDAELILRAYRVWGPDCVQHLLGDFAFGIWDDARQLLFCARDHMGVKPFYYARMGTCVMFSNTLDCIRRHPLVSNRLNDLAIADFLLFGFNQEPATTCFAGIQRIPAAHSGIWSLTSAQIARYWSMPVDEPLFYKRTSDYADRFHHLLHECVADRLRSNDISIFMSGGIDSPALALVAQDALQQRYPAFQLTAFTQIDSFVPDERLFAAMAAARFGIPIHYWDWTDGVALNWEQMLFSAPEPRPDAYLAISERQFWKDFGKHSRIFLYGEGPDNALLLDWQPYITCLVKGMQFSLLTRSALATIASERCPPFWGRVSRRFKGVHFAEAAEPSYPTWLSRSLESCFHLRERWKRLNSHSPNPVHPVRPKAYASLQIPRWQTMFESFDFGLTRSSFEVRHPFMDIRMLRFLLAVPPLPWCRGKYLIRKSMERRLPEELLRRKKATPDMHLFRKFLERFCQPLFLPTPRIHDFVDPSRLAELRPSEDVERRLRVRSLNHWLQNSYRTSHNLAGRIPCDQFARQTSPNADPIPQEALPNTQIGSVRRPA